MKLSPSHAYEDQKANHIWNKYDTAKQDVFWGNYEKLIAENKRSQLNKPQKTNKKVEKIKYQTFERSTSAYLFNFLLVFLSPVIGVGIASEGGPAFIIAVVFILCLTISIAAARTFNNFEVDNNYFYVHKPFCFTRTPFKWSEIDAVILQKMKSDDHVSFYIKLKTKSNEYEFSYGLNGATHKKLITIIRKKIPNTTFKKINC
ncbi:MAG TPA: hypothetical protein DCS93_01340 [Microscillaceae bacterium]|nr:hypothetical protein [Microscillaceae bacterium]